MNKKLKIYLIMWAVFLALMAATCVSFFFYDTILALDKVWLIKTVGWSAIGGSGASGALIFYELKNIK